ncbi:hypothetical protein NDU88_010263 [Pleurodeles waltl]|uniref:Uncharacterized protein n=1 Tax=Pleurodeles waltl TaxID=8319 RepID=A0AAV7S0U1_PLEWA|nr:hypothetical protein NDU88_010263 [Pleurodeles waltl]
MVPSRRGVTTRSLIHNSDYSNPRPHGGEGDPLMRWIWLRARLGPCPCRDGNPPPLAVALSREPRLNPCLSLCASERLNKVGRSLHPGQARQRNPLADHLAQARQRNTPAVYCQELQYETNEHVTPSPYSCGLSGATEARRRPQASLPPLHQLQGKQSKMRPELLLPVTKNLSRALGWCYMPSTL